MARCKKCKAEIAFLKTKKGKYIPVEWRTLTPDEKYDIQHGLKRIFVHGRHETHFANCPYAKNFRKPREPIEDKRYGD